MQRGWHAVTLAAKYVYTIYTTQNLLYLTYSSLYIIVIIRINITDTAFFIIIIIIILYLFSLILFCGVIIF